MTDSEKFTLLFVRKLERPRPCGRKHWNEIGLNYHFKKTYWIDQRLFLAWISRVNLYIGRKNEQKVLLLIETCSTHRSDKVLLTYNNMDIKLFLQNITSIIQPLDARIIVQVKAMFRTVLLFCVFENIEAEYNVEILIEMRLATTERNFVSTD